MYLPYISQYLLGKYTGSTVKGSVTELSVGAIYS